MIVYGDRCVRTAPDRLLCALSGAAARALKAADGRVELLRRLLIDAGELAQGLLDADFEQAVCGDAGPLQACCGTLTLEAARLWLAAGEMAALDLAPWLDALEQLAAMRLPPEIVVREPEGYAFYAIYPELYARAAVALKSVTSRPLR